MGVGSLLLLLLPLSLLYTHYTYCRCCCLTLACCACIFDGADVSRKRFQIRRLFPKSDFNARGDDSFFENRFSPCVISSSSASCTGSRKRPWRRTRPRTKSWKNWKNCPKYFRRRNLTPLTFSARSKFRADKANFQKLMLLASFPVQKHKPLLQVCVLCTSQFLSPILTLKIWPDFPLVSYLTFSCSRSCSCSGSCGEPASRSAWGCDA